MATDGKILIDGLVTRATSINTTLIAALTVVATLLLLKLAKKQEFSLYGVTLKTDWAPYIMMVFTLFHFYFEKLFVTGVKNLINQNEELAIVAWSKLSDNGPLFFNGLVSRLTLEETQLGQVFVMKSDDPTSWLTHGVAIATFAALVKLKDS